LELLRFAWFWKVWEWSLLVSLRFALFLVASLFFWFHGVMFEWSLLVSLRSEWFCVVLGWSRLFSIVHGLGEVTIYANCSNTTNRRCNMMSVKQRNQDKGWKKSVSDCLPLWIWGNLGWSRCASDSVRFSVGLCWSRCAPPHAP
jgi:hypothetical protein